MELTTPQFSELRACLTALEGQSRGGDKRRFNRLQVEGKVTLSDPIANNSYTALTRDLSIGGMGVIQSVRAARGQRLVATLPRSGNNALRVVCLVVEAQPLADGLYAVDLNFEGIAPNPPSV